MADTLSPSLFTVVRVFYGPTVTERSLRQATGRRARRLGYRPRLELPIVASPSYNEPHRQKPRILTQRGHADRAYAKRILTRPDSASYTTQTALEEFPTIDIPFNEVIQGYW